MRVMCTMRTPHSRCGTAAGLISAVEGASSPTKEVKDEKDKEICRVCAKAERGTEMLLCDGCDAGTS